MTAMYSSVTLSSVKRRPLIATVLRPCHTFLQYCWGVESKNAPLTPLLPLLLPRAFKKKRDKRVINTRLISPKFGQSDGLETCKLLRKTQFRFCNSFSLNFADVNKLFESCLNIKQDNFLIASVDLLAVGRNYCY